ncbi:MAG: alpha/beta fold hydrolase [Candidatus Acidiferrales bacterium]|jgi:pimeloyl-ACP methyl ester carboxylesterase
MQTLAPTDAPLDGSNTEASHHRKNGLTRREFAAWGAAGLSAALLESPFYGAARRLRGSAASSEAGGKAALDLAEWSYFWVGVERAELARGIVVNGKQMYVEYMIPKAVKHPYPIVLIHGGGGQGTDWMGTPDGRPGWATYLVQEGYAVYVVDRPGHGRPPFHPDLHGPFPAQAPTLEGISGRFTPPNPTSSNKPLPFQHLHNQWPGKGDVGSPDLDQFAASQGGSYVSPPGASAGAVQSIAHQVWRERGALMLDKIGPAIIVTHSAGGPFGWLVAEARPNLVKAIIAIEGGGQPFAGANVWGMSTIPVTYDPPVLDASELKTVRVDSPETGVADYRIQAEPARKLVNLQGIPIVMVTSEGSFAAPGNPGAVAFFKQAGCAAEELRLVDHGIHGNGHMMMVEKNNREVLQPILDWIAKNVEKDSVIPGPRLSESALELADQSFFWVGAEHKKMPYGTILTGQMYVQYLVPAQVHHRYPIVLVHGGTGQMLHYMGMGDGQAGWAHYYVQAGYRVYLLDRPGHGRTPYHPDALGPIGPQPTYDIIVPDLLRSHRWVGSGKIGDPSVDQLMASQNAAPQDNVMAHRFWASHGAELLDKIGPAIVQVHSAGGPFGWLVANERPHLVRAIVNVEAGGAPFSPQTPWGLTDIPLALDPPVSDPSQLETRDVAASNGLPAYKLQAEGRVHKLNNLEGIPIAYVTSERSGHMQGPEVVAFLNQAGCTAYDLQLKDSGVTGNGHFMMLETNRKQVFEVIENWLERNVSDHA